MLFLGKVCGVTVEYFYLICKYEVCSSLQLILSNAGMDVNIFQHLSIGQVE